MRSRLLMLAAAWLLATPAFAEPLPEIKDTLKAEAPYGKGDLRWLWMKAYDASLWTDTKPWSMSAPFALSLTYDMEFASEELADRSIDEMRRVSSLSKTQLETLRSILRRVFPNVKSGDRITALYLPGKSVRFFYNGAPKGKVTEPYFPEAFFGIWLSEKTSEPGLRRALLALERP
jgi:hypothetical protein